MRKGDALRSLVVGVNITCSIMTCQDYCNMKYTNTCRLWLDPIEQLLVEYSKDPLVDGLNTKSVPVHSRFRRSFDPMIAAVPKLSLSGPWAAYVTIGTP